jgi:hypothetical protein
MLISLEMTAIETLVGWFVGTIERSSATALKGFACSREDQQQSWMYGDGEVVVG